MFNLELREAQQHGSLTIFPIVNAEPRELTYELLGSALEVGTVEITEVGTGSIPELWVENEGETDVLILDGEQLIGAKQNRMTNRTIILAPHTKIMIPVSCMEERRWRFTSPQFRYGVNMSPLKVRRHARMTEAACVRANRVASTKVLANSQDVVWSDIAAFARDLHVRPEHDALDDLYAFKSANLEEWSKSFPWVDDQLGLLFPFYIKPCNVF